MRFKRKLVKVDDYHRCHAYGGEYDEFEVLPTLRAVVNGYYRHHRFIVTSIIEGKIKSIVDICKRINCDPKQFHQYLRMNPLIHTEITKLLQVSKGKAKVIDIDDLDLL